MLLDTLNTVTGQDNSVGINSLFAAKDSLFGDTLKQINSKITQQGYSLKKIEITSEDTLSMNYIFYPVICFLLLVIIGLIIKVKFKTPRKNNHNETNEKINQLSEQMEMIAKEINVLKNSVSDLSERVIHLTSEDIESKRKILEPANTTSESDSLVIKNEPIEKKIPIRYLRIDLESFYKEVYETNEETNLIENKYDEKNKISEVEVVKGIKIKSSAAKSRFTPLFEFDGETGEAHLLKPAKIKWEKDRAYLQEYGKIKLVE